MSKKLLYASFLCAALGTLTSASAQNMSFLPDVQLPTVPGAVFRPQNASSSTMQLVNGATGVENLFIHTWDGPTTSSNGVTQLHSGIAWRASDISGNTINEDFIYIKYASDIDAVIYEYNGAHFVLAAYYLDIADPALRGHYYDIYKFNSSGLFPVSVMTPLTSSPNFGNINVDATVYGLAITWCVPGTGIYVKTAELPGLSFGPDVLLPATTNNVAPDVSIRRGGGGSGSGLDLQLAFLDNTSTSVFEARVPFYDIFSGSTANFVYEYTNSVSGGNRYCAPRIDCPDRWGGGQRWAMTLGSYNYNPATTINTELVQVVIRNEDWAGGPPTWSNTNVINLNSATYAAGWFPSTYPVVAYNNHQDQITVGWMTMQSTAVISGTTNIKYVAMDITDDGTALPSIVPGSYNMISNAPCEVMPVLAFSGQDMNSNNEGLHVAFSEYIPTPPFYLMKYKDRKWGMSTFKGEAKIPVIPNLTISPNPFNNTLSFTVPGDGNYSISMTSLDGRIVYSHKEKLTAGQRFQVNTQHMTAGNYMVHITSPEQNINKTEQLVKF